MDPRRLASSDARAPGLQEAAGGSVTGPGGAGRGRSRREVATNSGLLELARGPQGLDARDTLRASDGRHEVWKGRARTSFLFVNGYCEPRPSAQDEWRLDTARSVQDQAGALRAHVTEGSVSPYRRPQRLLLCPRPRGAYRAVAALTAAAMAVAGTGCARHHWKAIPNNQEAVAGGRLAKKQVRLLTDSGPVTLVVRAVEFPLLEGEAVVAPDSGLVGVDLRRVLSAWTTRVEPGGTLRIQRQPVGEAEASPLAGRQVQFLTEHGSTALSVERVDFPYAVGRPTRCIVIDPRAVSDHSVSAMEYATCPGWVVADLRDAHRLEIRENPGPLRTVLLALGVIVVIEAVVVFVAGASGGLCPSVSVEGRSGIQLAGEGYPGAMWRSLQRDDLLPLPPLGNDAARVSLRNETQEVQYTDRAELLLVDHPEGVRALALATGEPVLVGPARGPLEVRDLEGREVTSLLADTDNQYWQSDLEGALASAEPSAQEGMVGRFAASGSPGQPVLEIVAANSGLLELAFGRHFAAMGRGFARYRAGAHRPGSGPGLRAWREREGVDLRVEVRRNGLWERVGVVPSPGSLASRRVALLLPADLAAGPVEVRLLGGLGFWRIDQLALSERFEGTREQRRLRPVLARGPGGRDERESLRLRDGRYQVLAEPGQELRLEFRLPPLRPGLRRTSFLFLDGYYEPRPPDPDEASPALAGAPDDSPGALSRHGLAAAREYLRRWREAPRLAAIESSS